MLFLQSFFSDWSCIHFILLIFCLSRLGCDTWHHKVDLSSIMTPNGPSRQTNRQAEEMAAWSSAHRVLAVISHCSSSSLCISRNKTLVGKERGWQWRWTSEREELLFVWICVSLCWSVTSPSHWLCSSPSCSFCFHYDHSSECERAIYFFFTSFYWNIKPIKSE